MTIEQRGKGCFRKVPILYLLTDVVIFLYVRLIIVYSMLRVNLCPSDIYASWLSVQGVTRFLRNPFSENHSNNTISWLDLQ